MKNKHGLDLRTLRAARHAILVLQSSYGLSELSHTTYLRRRTWNDLDGAPLARPRIDVCARGAFYLGSLPPKQRMKVFAALRGFRNVWDHDEITEYLVDAKNYDSTTIDEIEHVNQRMPGSDGNRLREVLAWLDDEIAAV